MARKFTDADFEDAPRRTFSEADFADVTNDAPADIQPSGQQPPPNPAFEVRGRSQSALGAYPSYAPPADPTYQGSNISPTRALLTNDPTSGVAEDLLRGVPATLGGIVGAATTIPSGPGSIAGAALGGAGGEGLRQGAAQIYAGATGRPFTPPSQVLSGMAIQGGLQGVGQTIPVAAAAAAPTARRIGAQAIRIGSGVPTKIAEAALRDPDMLLRARPASEVGKEIGDYLGSRTVTESVTDPLTGAVSQVTRPGGLKYNVEGLQELIPGKFVPSTADKFDLLNGAMGKLRSGNLGVQEALVARQQTSKMLSTPNWQNPELAAAKTEIGKALEELDAFIEPQLPEMGGLRQAYRDSKVAEEFSNWLPLNRNSSPNVLRSVLATREAAIGAGAALGMGVGSPAALLALPAISPKFYGTAIKGAALAGKIPAGVYQSGSRLGAGTAGSALEQAYLQRRTAP